jgi:hypothetical protein
MLYNYEMETWLVNRLISIIARRQQNVTGASSYKATFVQQAEQADKVERPQRKLKGIPKVL